MTLGAETKYDNDTLDSQAPDTAALGSSNRHICASEYEVIFILLILCIFLL